MAQYSEEDLEDWERQEYQRSRSHAEVVAAVEERQRVRKAQDEKASRNKAAPKKAPVERAPQKREPQREEAPAKTSRLVRRQALARAGVRILKKAGRAAVKVGKRVATPPYAQAERGVPWKGMSMGWAGGSTARTTTTKRKTTKKKGKKKSTKRRAAPQERAPASMAWAGGGQRGKKGKKQKAWWE